MAVGSFRHQHSKGKFKMTSFRVVYRSVLNHPFLMVLLLFLICLHRYFPFLFYLLVTASPVFICTAVLLGTLLIYGQPNVNNVKCDEEKTNNISVSLKTGVVNHSYSADREGIFSKDIFAEIRKDIVEKGMRSTSEMLGSGIRGNVDLTDDKAKWEFRSLESSEGREIRKEKSKNGYGFSNFEKQDVRMSLDRDYDKSIKESHDVGLQDRSESSLGKHNNEDEVVNPESSDCESDGAEKCCFDALVADVIPTAQETHPLLDSEDPLRVDAPPDESLKFELQSFDSDQSSDDSGEDETDDHVDGEDTSKAKDAGDNVTNAWIELEKSQHLESLITRTNDDRDDEEEMKDDASIEDVDMDIEVDDDDEDDDEEEDEENTIVEKNASKHVTMWTEEDEKNLRLVGNSELERDLRLENLLARRRVKRNFSMISERNLIDLDHPDHLPFQVAPISTTKVNPFDTPHDTNHHHFSDIPPIPGSAPSVSVPRKNPFDSPCTSPKGIQNLTEEIPKEKLRKMNLNNDAAVFHEHGSSSTGYSDSPLGNVLKPDFVETNRKDALFRRYESFSTGYNFMGDDSRQSDFIETDRRDALLRRRETFNARSAFPSVFGPPENLSFIKMKPVFVTEQVVGDQEIIHPSSGRESVHDSESSVSSSDSDNDNMGLDKEEEAHYEQLQYGDATADSDHASSHYEETSDTSSEKIHSRHDDQEEVFMDSLEANAEVNADQIYQKAEVGHENHDNASSNTSVTSGVDHSSEIIGQDEDETIKEDEFSPKASSIVSDAITEPPVFDSSPSGAEKITPFSS